jgi:phospho-N-acetylmuramoyl-pentapeptide-transferase
MLYLLLSPFAEQFTLFNVLNYLTFRTGAAIMTAFVVALVVGMPFIGWLRKQGSQPIRDDGPESHVLTKAGTPTMGGFIILTGILTGILKLVKHRSKDLDVIGTWKIGSSVIDQDQLVSGDRTL